MANTHTSLSSLFTAIANSIRGKTGGTGTLVADNFPSAIDGITTLSGGSADATAAAGDILSGKTAYVKGSKVTGTIAMNGDMSKTLNAGESTTIRKGYYYSDSTITAKDLASQTDGTAVAGDILSGKTAYVDGAKVTGTIATKTSDDLTVSGRTVSVPAGYYASAASKSVAIANRGITTISATANDTNDTLTVTGSNNQSTGYVTGATKTASDTITLTQNTPSIDSSTGVITASSSMKDSVSSVSVSQSKTLSLTTQAATTITPTTSAQTAVPAGRYTTGAVKVAAMPTGRVVGPSISLDKSTGVITASAVVGEGYVAGETKSTTANSTTLDTNLKAENIANGVKIFGVTGTLKPGFDEFMQTITASGTFTVPATGKYRVTAIGAGSAAKYRDSSTTWYCGCCGGGGYVEMNMTAGTTYTATINGYAQLANSSGTVLIKATAASGPSAGAAGTSGTVSGSGVTAFSSNGKSSQKDIIPPDFYNNSRYVSRGGYGGWSLSDIEAHSTDSSHSQSQDRNGGAGLFGGSGSDGGDAGHGYVVAMGYSTGAFYTNPVRDPEAGGGKGGRGIAEYDGSAGGASPYNLPGGGGGGGYGGGGGISGTRTYTYYNTRYIYGNGGNGGAACIFIHRIG